MPDGERLPHDPGPHWGEVGIHGLHRQREWDTVAAVSRTPQLDVLPATVEIAAVTSDTAVALEPAGLDVSALVSAVRLAPPWRGIAARRDDGQWAVAARQIRVIELVAEPGGSAIEVVVDGDRRTITVDDQPLAAALPELERLGEPHHAYVVRAERLTGRWWQADVDPL